MIIDSDIVAVSPNSAIGYITPKDKLEVREKQIFAERDRKLHEARELRKIRRRKQKKALKEHAHVELTFESENSI